MSLNDAWTIFLDIISFKAVFTLLAITFENSQDFIYFLVLNNAKTRFFGIKQCLNKNFLVLNDALMRFFA